MCRNNSNCFAQNPENTTEAPLVLELNGLPDKTEDVLISEEVFNTLEIIVNVYLINGLSVIGTLGNITSIIILFIDGFKSSTNVVLMSMAVADLLLVSTMPLRKISLIIKYFDPALSITVENSVIGYHFLTLNRVWSLISNTQVAIVSAERVIAVNFPFQVSRWVTVPRMTVIVVLTHVMWYLALIPQFTMFDLKTVWEPALNDSIVIISVTKFYLEREILFNTYYSYFINISVGAFLLLFTLMCCITIMVKIRKMSQKRNLLTGGSARPSMKERSRENNGNDVTTISSRLSIKFESSQQQQTSPIDMKALKMLMTVCVTFLVLIFPTFFLPLFQGIFPKLRNPYWRHVNFVASSMSMLLITINSSVNFIIYIMLSSRFHRTFLHLFTCKKWKKMKADKHNFDT